MNAIKTLGLFVVIGLVAVVVGVVLADPLTLSSLGTMGVIIAAMSFPVVRRWNYEILVFSINAPFVAGFLPGSPYLWTVMSMVTLGFAIVDKALSKRREDFIAENRQIAWTLGILLFVVLAVAAIRQDLGGSIFGSEKQGLRKYFSVVMSIVAYFAISSRALDPEKGKRLVLLSAVSGAVTIVTDLVWFLGPTFYSVFMFIAPPSTHGAALSETGDTAGLEIRLVGITTACLSGVFWMFCKWGITGIADVRRWWRFASLLLLMAFGTLGGFRSFFLVIAWLVLVFGHIEGFFTKARGLVLVGIGCVSFLGLAVFAEHLPFGVQRSLSFLPVSVDPAARASAEVSSNWRFDMWKVLLDELPDYLVIGKGYGFSATDLWIVELMERQMRGYGYERSMLLGDYHSGPLTLIMPFGVPGVVAFSAFLYFSIKHLRKMYLESSAAMRSTHLFLYGYFIVRTLNYVFVYGHFNLDLILFTSTVGLSVAIWRGQSRPVESSWTVVPLAPAKGLLPLRV